MSDKIRSGRTGENRAAIEANWPFPDRRADAKEDALLTTLRSLFEGRTVYVMAREHVADESLPLYEVQFGTVIHGKIFFTKVES